MEERSNSASRYAGVASICQFHLRRDEFGSGLRELPPRAEAFSAWMLSVLSDEDGPRARKKLNSSSRHQDCTFHTSFPATPNGKAYLSLFVPTLSYGPVTTLKTITLERKQCNNIRPSCSIAESRLPRSQVYRLASTYQASRIRYSHAHHASGSACYAPLGPDDNPGSDRCCRDCRTPASSRPFTD